MTWLVDDNSHVIPQDDLREHKSAADCWCAPRQDEEDPHIWIHNSMDGRELFERGERQLS